ncbi:MAG: hypothetical protein IJK04_09920, partial [Kiritimatiellae bacterium]|nr:hypothetical protein [Kiritimatiellia bacterium]
FYAGTPQARAGIVEIAGRRCAFSQSAASTFVDGRPDRHDGTGPADTANAAALADFADLGIKTDGAFRLERDGATGDLLLTPIPGSAPFRAEIDLAKVGVPGFASGHPAATPLRGCEPIEPSLDAAWPVWKQDGSILSLSLDAKAFAYRIVF